MKTLKQLAFFKLLLASIILFMVNGLTANFAVAAPLTQIKFATEATYPPVVSMESNGHIGGFETELVKKNLSNCEY